jgi:hypothetical protein
MTQSMAATNEGLERSGASALHTLIGPEKVE